MLNDLKKDKLQQLLHDSFLFDIIKEVFEMETEKVKPKVNAVDNDETLGQKYRAYIEAQDIIAHCFAELENYKVERGNKETPNRAI